MWAGFDIDFYKHDGYNRKKWIWINLMDEFLWPADLGERFLPLLQKNLNDIESTFGIDMSIRGNKIMYQGSAAAARKFRKYLDFLQKFIKETGRIRDEDISISLHLAEAGQLSKLREQGKGKAPISFNGKEVLPKTFNQKEYIRAIDENELVFGIGPAGTGKTFLAIAMALKFLFNRTVERIVLTRPVVEAGEKLGFLPGDIYQKINPYLRPLYDALYYLIGMEKTSDFIEKGIIEIAPLAYMRGRTINSAFIILDEGQNTGNSQMKMFLTRFGQNSRVVVTGDITQIDLDDPKKSGIFKALSILSSISGIGIVRLTKRDIIRHPLVQKIVDAYEKNEK